MWILHDSVFGFTQTSKKWFNIKPVHINKNYRSSASSKTSIVFYLTSYNWSLELKCSIRKQDIYGKCILNVFILGKIFRETSFLNTFLEVFKTSASSVVIFSTTKSQRFLPLFCSYLFISCFSSVTVYNRIIFCIFVSQ